jgi:glutamine synthetase
MDKFSFDVANRGCSVRIPRTVEKSGRGYYEDRRPAANVDPYVASSALFSTTCLENYGLDDLVRHYNAFIELKKSK